MAINLVIRKQKEYDKVDKLLKQFKKKSKEYGIIKEYQERQQFIKKSARLRQKKLSAARRNS